MSFEGEALLAEWGIASLRSEQAAAVAGFLSGSDVLAVLPTGYGKSLCYQLPAVLLARRGAGCTLVVSPLIALMDDQVASLRARGVRAVALHSAIPWAEQRAALARLADYELVYVSPERLQNTRVRSSLSGVARVAIDEAHCISEWGHDFRPDYARLGWVKRELALPVMALTATATRKVRDDICRSLALAEPLRVERGAARPNLRFCVALSSREDTRTVWATELLTERGFAGRRAAGRAIVYVVTRKRAQAVQRALRRAGIRAGYYHAGRSESARRTAVERFAAGTTPVLVATSAFGMGIDMPAVRVVLHVESPGTLEGYVQQAGRAGRDGAEAECWLAFSPADARIHQRLRGGALRRETDSDFAALSSYALGDGCRQQAIARHLDGSEAAACGRCDLCTDGSAVRAARQRSEAAQTRAGAARASKRAEQGAIVLGERERECVVAFVDALHKPVGRRYLAQALRGSRARVLTKKRLAHNPHFGALRGLPEQAILEAVEQLVEEGLLVPKGKKYPTLWIAGKPVRTRGMARSARPTSTLEAALKRFRSNEARRRRIKPYQVFQDRTLRAICDLRPCSMQALAGVWGIGEERLEKYGRALLELCAAGPALTRSAG